MITADCIRRLAPSARADLVAAIVDNWPYAQERGITTPIRIRHFMAQICVETGGLRSIEENLNYSARRLTQGWPTRFKTLAAAKPYANNPKALALKVYGGRNGNRPGTDDGWTYRGSGFLQNTGRANFRLAGCENDPDALRTRGPGFRAAVDYWTKHKLNTLADVDDLEAIRRKINGGKHGLSEAAEYLRNAEKIWPNGASPVASQLCGGSAAQVAYVQERLRELGYYEVGEIDSEFGPRSRDALNAFKADNGLPLVVSLDVGENITDDAVVALYSAGPRQMVSVDGRPVVELASPAARPSPRLTQPCAQPVAIRPDMQDRQLSAGLTERLWGEDRSALRTCRDRQLALARFIRERDAALAGTAIEGEGSNE